VKTARISWKSLALARSHPFLEDDPPIAILAEGERTLRIAVWTLQGDEHELVSGRLHALFL
jgi:hypothetical protein